MARTSRGRRKIQIAKIVDHSNLQVTFSKRRAGLFKKASELSTLCGAEVTVIVFSPADKAYSFGHPCVAAVVDRFLAGNNGEKPPEVPDLMGQLMEEQRTAFVHQQNMHLTHILTQLEAEKKRGAELDQAAKASQSQAWWTAPIEELSLSQLQQLKASLENLKRNIDEEAQRVLIQPHQPPPPVPYFGEASSSDAGPSNAVPFDYANMGEFGGQVPNPYGFGYGQGGYY